jgi:predicted hydrocarbon binding protein
MFWFFTKNLATGNIKLEEGDIQFIGQRMVFLPAKSLIEIHKLMIKKFGKKDGCNLIYEIFKTGAIYFADKMRQDWGTIGTTQIVKRMEEVANASGWGKIRIIDFDDKNYRMLIEIENSPFAKEPSLKKYACNITRGFIAGTLTGLFKKDVDGVERICGVMGFKKCVLVFKPKDGWKNIVSKDLRIAASYQLPYFK